MAQPVDAKAYYGYLFESDKKPTKVLDALLRGIANYIIESVGDKNDKNLSPAKLATFYKAVGGNYDSLFSDVPHPSISWIYASIGCQHTLQPTTNEFEPPSIPALTQRGFVRWQSIEILLGPEEHVPFIQSAVRDFGIKNPGTGENFPADLPKEAFPLEPDVEIERWHNECAVKLRNRASLRDNNPDDAAPRPDLPPRPKVQPGYPPVPIRLHRPVRGDTEFFDPRSRISRPLSYQHVSSVAHGARTVRPKLSRSPSHRARQFLAPEEDLPQDHVPRSRRRSYPENLNSPDTPIERVTKSPPDTRWHNQPRHASPGGAPENDDDPPSPKTPAVDKRSSRPHSHFHSTRAGHESEPEISPRFVPAVPAPPDARRRVPRGREDEIKRRSNPVPVDPSGKLSAPFILHREKERDKDGRSISRDKKKLSWKDLSEVTERWRRSAAGRDAATDETAARHRREKERDGYRERDRERERERPRTSSTRTSYEDLLMRRDRDRERERERETAGRGGGLDNRTFRDRDRDHEKERFAVPMRDGDGRNIKHQRIDLRKTILQLGSSSANEVARQLKVFVPTADHPSQAVEGARSVTAPTAPITAPETAAADKSNPLGQPHHAMFVNCQGRQKHPRLQNHPSFG
ncbi:uncharacterized protein BP5553_02531 [Venustampulla echinocandica]|uniref:DUF7514 domain-containing protein n=1 Tax=Venustampulla echinocandica TaxID=2656787 RepID=A0A370U450_9HELO|nr:uncharacterized protein BP5553_02531 [Venustampulla echinocandica]RDL42552.1 hypothetical protein BP5553_02531 [Venustampulla echinocandica]